MKSVHSFDLEFECLPLALLRADLETSLHLLGMPMRDVELTLHFSALMTRVFQVALRRRFFNPDTLLVDLPLERKLACFLSFLKLPSLLAQLELFLMH